jgi:D-alanyl-D-alanine carboxypeptidase
MNNYLEVEDKQKRLILSWENTNKLLWNGFSGVKTGITPNAGPCLSASMKK